MLATASAGFAQEKIRIGVLEFSSGENSQSQHSRNRTNSQPNEVKLIQEEVERCFVKTNRFIVVDRTKLNELKKERELQKTEDFIDSDTKLIEQGKNMGIEYLVSGYVITETKSSKVDLIYLSIPKNSASISIVLKLIKIETGEIVNSVAIKTSSSNIQKALKKVEEEVNEFVSSNFPITLPIIDIQKRKVLISGGSAIGLKKGDEFLVCEVISVEVSGKIINRNKEIGRIKIEKVEDENFSLCLIKEGEEEITTKFGNTKLQVKSITK
jgi:hypothetical protein